MMPFKPMPPQAQGMPQRPTPTPGQGWSGGMPQDMWSRLAAMGGPGMNAPKGGISSHPKNIYREPIDRALQQAPATPPPAYWPQDTRRYRAT
jgi:hypothetical protein